MKVARLKCKVWYRRAETTASHCNQPIENLRSLHLAQNTHESLDTGKEPSTLTRQTKLVKKAVGEENRQH